MLPTQTISKGKASAGIVGHGVPIQTGRLVFVLHAALALATVVGCQNGLARPGEPGSATVPTRAQASTAPRDNQGQATLDGSAVCSRLIVRTVGKDKDARQVVVLGRPTGVRDIPDYSQPSRPDMLPREMVRQAALIAARDELGVATRDEVIDETPTDRKDGGGSTVEVVSFIRDNRSQEIIRRLENEKSETLFSHETPTAPGRNLDILKLLVSAEALSREEFPKVFKGMGLKGKPNAVKDDAGLPTKVEDRLTSLEFLDVLLAVRDVHRAIRNDGESPSRLGALARGYALLGVLSEFQWHPAHRAFKGRSLLYAQRCLARDRSTPWGLWNRAFALALIGRHSDALADLDEAKKKAGVNGSPAAPDWIEVVDAFAHYDSTRLKRVQGPQAKLAGLLRMFTLAFPRSTAVGLHAANDVVLLEPYCFRAHDAMSDFFGVSTQHATNMMGPQALEHYIFNKLPAVEELPASVKDRLNDNPGIVRVAELLDKAGTPESDGGEPSWGVMGHVLRETRFVQVFRRLYFMKVMLAIEADDAWNEVKSDVAGHRYAPYLESLALTGRDTAERFQKFADGLDLTEIETTESAMNRSLWNLERPKAKAAWNIAMAHEDETAEMAVSLSQASDQNQIDIARMILIVSPYNAFARSILIVRDWDKVKDQVPSWEKEPGDSPAVLSALGVQYSKTKQYDDAQRVLSRYIEISPDVWAYQLLAANFKTQGNIDRWQKTLDEFLDKVDDLGLDHAKVRVEIADHYMGLKQWDKAKPYAEAAAATWAGWAMNCAARCAEGEQDWERAESWYSRVTERYPDDSWAVWYFFCKRTGHGNLEAARNFVEEYVTTHADRPAMLNGEYAGCFYWFDGRPEKAKETFRNAYEKGKSVSAALCLAMIADDEKDPGRRDALLKEVITKQVDKTPSTLTICQLLLETILDPGGKKPLDIKALDQLIESIREEARDNARFFAGWLLKNHGDAEKAKKYLQSCSESSRALIWYRYLAYEALKRSSGK